jgi:hypothetical protein
LLRIRDTVRVRNKVVHAVFVFVLRRGQHPRAPAERDDKLTLEGQTGHRLRLNKLRRLPSTSSCGV